VVGGTSLRGEVPVVGAKNSALKLMAVALLAVGRTRLSNVPAIVDVTIMAELLRRLGCTVDYAADAGVVEIDVPERIGHRADYDLVRALRASISVLGPLVARCGKADVAVPGGDAIGSRGLDLHGFEVKTVRSDWLRELKHPEKAEESIVSYCDYWWIAVSHDDVVKRDELPEPWGLLVLDDKGKSLLVAKPAVKRADVCPLDRVIVAAMLRRVGESMVPKGALAQMIEEGVARGIEDAHERKDYGHKAMARSYEEIKRAKEEFEKASGLTLSNWQAGDIGDAVRSYMEMRREMGAFGNLIGRYETEAERILSRIRESRKALEGVSSRAKEMAP